LAFGVSLNPKGLSESSGSETDNSEAESCDDMDEIKEEYNKLHVFSKKLMKVNDKLSDKVKNLENILNERTQERDENNKEIELLLEKNKALTSAKSKEKLEDDTKTGTQVLDHILSIQRHPSDRSGLGYHATSSTPPIGKEGTNHKDKKKNANGVQNKLNSPTPKKQTTIVVNEHPKRKEVKTKVINNAKSQVFTPVVKFVPTCHYCGMTGHIRPHCRKMHESNTSHDAYVAHSYGHNNFVPTCHHCGIRGHIRPYCFALHGYHRTPPHYHNMNNHREYYQRPRRRTSSHANSTKVNPKPMPIKKTRVEKGKPRQMWVRKMDLVSPVDDDLDSLDDYSSLGEVDLAF
jgi:hypothetical protein